jgi:hypothetical protein
MLDAKTHVERRTTLPRKHLRSDIRLRVVGRYVRSRFVERSSSTRSLACQDIGKCSAQVRRARNIRPIHLLAARQTR